MLAFSEDQSERTAIDKSTIEKLFCIFDENNIGSIDFKELLVAIEISQQTKIRNLVKCFVEIADIRSKGVCTEPMLSHVFTAISFNPEEKVRVRNLSRIHLISKEHNSSTAERRAGPDIQLFDG